MIGWLATWWAKQRAANPWAAMTTQHKHGESMDFIIPPDLVIHNEFGTAATDKVNWGIAACTIDRLRAAGGDGEGEIVAVLDTGVDPNHPEFVGRWHAEPWSNVPGESFYDGHGHGTHCLGTAAGSSSNIGVNNKSKLLAGKCLSNRGSGTDTMIMASAEKAFNLGATVISLSIGGNGPSNPEFDALLRRIDESGRCVVVAASGNERSQGGQTTFPGRYPTVLAVAAVSENGQIAPFSNPGQTATTLAIAAPGTNIWSAAPGGGYQQMSGTSMATPFVAGVVAAYQSARTKKGLPRLTGSQIRELFRTRAVDAGTPGPDRDFGPGRISGWMLAQETIADPPAVG